MAFTEMASQRVLIFGGLGFIGSNLARAWAKVGASVTVFDNLDPRAGGNVANINGYRDRISIVFQDILNFDHLAQHVVDQDIIVNCAASTSHPFSMREPWIDMDVNSRGMINLLEAVRRYNPQARFVHLGTTTQLGRLLYAPADENHPEYPTDIYSANKSASEKYVLIYANTYGLNATVLRLSNVYGPRACIRSPEFTFNNYFIGLALQDAPICVFGDGSQRRNVLYVDDAVSSVTAAALGDAGAGQTYFAVGDAHYTVAEIADATVLAMRKGRVEHVPWPAGRKQMDVGDAIISNQKIKSALGWSPQVGLADGLERTRVFFTPRLAEYLG